MYPSPFQGFIIHMYYKVKLCFTSILFKIEIDIIKSAIQLYYKFKKDNIIGKQRINYIKSIFNIHINTLYNWINIYYIKHSNTFNFINYRTNFKYNNLKITFDIEQFIINPSPFQGFIIHMYYKVKQV